MQQGYNLDNALKWEASDVLSCDFWIFLQVDLLGDEVEALTDLLAKIYIALDHYSPVLQHYSGVTLDN